MTHLQTGAAASAPARRKTSAQQSLRTTLGPLVLDLGLPVATYYLARNVFDTNMITAFVASSIVSFARTAFSALRERRVNAMSALVLAVNLAGLALSFASGSVRFMSGKDAIISSVLGVGVLVSVWRGRPALAEGLRPFVTKGRADKEAAWTRLAQSSPQFTRLVAAHSVVFGVAFLADTIVRIVCAAVAPLSVLAWIGTACTVGAIVAGSIVGGALTVEPLTKLLEADADADAPVDGPDEVDADAGIDAR